MGQIHAAIIKYSARHKRIVELFQEAEYPLSAQDIALRAYPNSNPPKVMLNVSTNIGEMRSQDNIDDGYIVSFSTKWKIAAPGQDTGKRVNRDGSVTFYVPAARYPWHDGRPRYYLIAAPGWTPRWTIDEHGNLRRRGEYSEARRAAPDLQPEAMPLPAPIPAETVALPPVDAGPPSCVKCRATLPPDHRGAPFCEECRPVFVKG